MIMCLKISRWLAALILLSALLTLLVPVAQADGGAPNLAYVSDGGKGVSVIDVSQQKVVNTINAGGDPHLLALSADGRFLYVAEPQAGRLAAIAAKTGTTFCSAKVPGQPNLLVMDVNNTTLYMAGQGAASVTVIDANTCAIKRTLHTNGPVYGLAVAAIGAALTANNGDQLWVATANTLTIFDDNSGRQLGQVSVPAGPRYLTIPARGTAYVTTQQGSVEAVDLNTHRVTLLVSGGVYGPMDYDATTGEVYVPDQKNKQLLVLAPVNSGFAPPKEPTRVIKLQASPVSIAITSDGQLGFAALTGGNVAMLDIPARGQLITTITVGGDPRFIITGLYPPAFGTTPQQAAFQGTIISIAAYTLVLLLLIVPIVLFIRYSKKQKTSNTIPTQEAVKK